MLREKKSVRDQTTAMSKWSVITLARGSGGVWTEQETEHVSLDTAESGWTSGPLRSPPTLGMSSSPKHQSAQHVLLQVPRPERP